MLYAAYQCHSGVCFLWMQVHLHTYLQGFVFSKPSAYCIVGKFGKLNLFMIRQLAKELIYQPLGSTNFDGYSLVNHAWFAKFAKLFSFTVSLRICVYYLWYLFPTMISAYSSIPFIASYYLSIMNSSHIIFYACTCPFFLKWLCYR